VLSLVVALGLLLLVAELLPSGSRRPKLPRVVMNLMQIDLAKQMWASEHAAANGAVVTEQQLIDRLRLPGRTGLVAVVDSEIYRVNAIGTPPEALLERPFGPRFPKGTLLRWSTNAGCEILLPNPQGGANGWQPLYSGTSRMSPAAAPRH
jgi:hypothetical protein